MDLHQCGAHTDQFGMAPFSHLMQHLMQLALDIKSADLIQADI